MMTQKQTQWVTISAAVLISTALGTGCSSNQNQKVVGGGPSGQMAEQKSAAWKLTLNQTCSASTESNADSCLASHGFTVSEDGTYQAGPTPSGEVLKGQLSSSEFAAIAKPINDTLERVGLQADPSENCVAQAQDAAEIGESTLTLSPHAQGKQIFRADKSQICSRGMKQDQADALHKAMLDLAKKHYPLPFPSACTTSAASIEKLYAPLKSCQQDSDCTYVDQNYVAVHVREVQFIATDSCTWYSPLVVANTAQLEGAQAALIHARDAARAACGSSIVRPSCGTLSGFQASAVAAPTCVQGSCRAPN